MEKKVFIKAEDLKEQYVSYVKKVMKDAPMSEEGKDFYIITTKLLFEGFIRSKAEDLEDQEETNENSEA